MRLHSIHFPLCHLEFTFAAVVVCVTFVQHESKCLAGMLPSDNCLIWPCILFHLCWRFSSRYAIKQCRFSRDSFQLHCKTKHTISIINLNWLTSRAVSFFSLFAICVTRISNLVLISFEHSCSVRQLLVISIFDWSE